MHLPGRGERTHSLSPAEKQRKRRVRYVQANRRECEKVKESAIYRCLHRLFSNSAFELFFTLAILGNFVLVILETDAVADGEQPQSWIEPVSWIILVSFVLELALRLYILGLGFWKDAINSAEFVLVSVDIVLNLMSLTGSSVKVSFLRVVRLCKLARVAKVFKVFPELRLMMAGLLGSVRALFWGAVLLVFTLLMWSVIAVQFIHPLNKRLAEEGVYDDVACLRCPIAYSSVFNAFLTFCQTIVTGDSWGATSIPLIENTASTGLFFAAVYITVGLAALNLILGVVVQVASEAREELEAEMEDEHILENMQLKTNLLDMFDSMDLNHDGVISKNELFHAYNNNEVFQKAISNMDITEEDVHILWSVLDEDGSGSINYAEFVTNVYKMKNSSADFMLAYVKYYVTEIKHKICTELKDAKHEIMNSWMFETNHVSRVSDRDLFTGTRSSLSSLTFDSRIPTTPDERMSPVSQPRAVTPDELWDVSIQKAMIPDITQEAEDTQIVICNLNQKLQVLVEGIMNAHQPLGGCKSSRLHERRKRACHDTPEALGIEISRHDSRGFESLIGTILEQGRQAQRRLAILQGACSFGLARLDRGSKSLDPSS